MKTTGEQARRQRQLAVRGERKRLHAVLGREPTEDELQPFRESLYATADLTAAAVEWEPCPEDMGDGRWRALVVSLVLAPGRWRSMAAAMGQASAMADALRKRTMDSTLVWRPDARIADEHSAAWEGIVRSRAAGLGDYPSEPAARAAAERLAHSLELAHYETRRIWPPLQ